MRNIFAALAVILAIGATAPAFAAASQNTSTYSAEAGAGGR